METGGLPLEVPSNNQREGEDSGQPQFHCEPCRDDTYHFDRARSFLKYQDSLVRAIVLLKFEEMDSLADRFADRLARWYLKLR